VQAALIGDAAEENRGGEAYPPASRPKREPSRQDPRRTAEDELTETKLEDANLQFRRGKTGSWERAVQLKGSDYYIAAQGSDNSMVGIQEAKVHDDQIRFALRMDIAGKGDSWISADDNTGSIRMRDDSNRRAHLVALRRGDNPDDATGGYDAKFHPMSWAELIDEI